MKQTLEIKLYDLISRAVSEGISIGWNRAHKHTEEPSVGHIVETLEMEVMNALCEIIEFSEGD